MALPAAPVGFVVDVCEMVETRDGSEAGELDDLYIAREAGSCSERPWAVICGCMGYADGMPIIVASGIGGYKDVNGSSILRNDAFVSEDDELRLLTK